MFVPIIIWLVIVLLKSIRKTEAPKDERRSSDHAESPIGSSPFFSEING